MCPVNGSASSRGTAAQGEGILGEPAVTASEFDSVIKRLV